jgi:hypothetical protein
VSGVVFDELVRAAEAASSCNEGFGSASAEVYVSGIDIVVDSGNIVGRVIRDPRNSNDDFTGCVWIIYHESSIEERAVIHSVAKIEVVGSFP